MDRCDEGESGEYVDEGDTVIGWKVERNIWPSNLRLSTYGFPGPSSTMRGTMCTLDSDIPSSYLEYTCPTSFTT